MTGNLLPTVQQELKKRLVLDLERRGIGHPPQYVLHKPPVVYDRGHVLVVEAQFRAVGTGQIAAMHAELSRAELETRKANGRLDPVADLLRTISLDIQWLDAPKGVPTLPQKPRPERMPPPATATFNRTARLLTKKEE